MTILSKTPCFNSFGCYPEGSDEYMAHNLFINAKRFRWDAYTINAMVREAVAINPDCEPVYDAMREAFTYSGIVIHLYYNPAECRWEDSKSSRFDHATCCKKDWTGGIRYASDHWAPYFPNDIQRERMEFEAKEKRVFLKSQTLLTNGRAVNVRHNKFHFTLLRKGWRYLSSVADQNHADHTYERPGSERQMVIHVTKHSQHWTMLHPNGRDHSSFGGVNEFSKYLAKYSK